MSFHPLWFDVLGFFQSLVASRAAETRDESIVDRPVVHAEYYSEARKRIIFRDGDVHDDNINSRQGAERKKVEMFRVPRTACAVLMLSLVEGALSAKTPVCRSLLAMIRGGEFGPQLQP
jgi:hypothetical protein